MPPWVIEIIKTIASSYSALLVAFVAGAFSLLGLILAKENKVSDFRQAWIEALREDVAEFTAQAALLRTETLEYVRRANERREYVESYQDYLDRTRDALREFNRASTRIALRLHLEKRDNESLMKSMVKLHKILEEIPTDLAAYNIQFSEISKAVEIQMAELHASEWERVKAGERTFRVSKCIAIVVLIFTMLLLALPTLMRLWGFR